MKHKLSRIIALLLIISIGIGAYFFFNKKEDKTELTLFGNIEIRTVDLGFRVEGRIKKMFFEEGDSVKKGDLLAILDDTNYSATFEKSIADVDKAKIANSNATSKYERNLPLCSEETVSKQDCDDLQTTKDETSSNLKSLTAQSKLAKNNLNDTKIYAPDDGIIMTRIQEEGASVSPTQIIYTMSKTKPVWIRAYVNETDLGNIKYEMKAKVLTDSIDPQTGKQRIYQGRIGYISPVAEFTPKTVQTTDLRTDLVYRVRIYVDVVDDFLRQGMPTTIKINLIEK